VCVLAWSLVEGLEAEEEGESVDVLVRVRRVHGKPVLKGRHVERRNVQDVQQPLVSPGAEHEQEGLRGGRGVKAHDGVGDEQLVLPSCGRELQVVGREVPIKVG